LSKTNLEDLPSARLLLVRHAQHDTSSEDGRLTPLGQQQVRALAGALCFDPNGSLVSSPLPRAIATASSIGRRFDVIDDLEEFRFGLEAPGTSEMVEQRQDLTLWQPDHAFPGGETLMTFQVRVRTLLEMWATEHLGTMLAAVTHSGWIDAALRWAYQVPLEAEWVSEATLPNASITEVEHWPSGRHSAGAPRFTLVERVGDIAHLGKGLVTEI
jgi:2,3-bisphosphoglycerate-dependent phosphoglycerate mutase